MWPSELTSMAYDLQSGSAVEDMTGLFLNPRVLSGTDEYRDYVNSYPLCNCDLPRPGGGTYSCAVQTGAITSDDVTFFPFSRPLIASPLNTPTCVELYHEGGVVGGADYAQLWYISPVPTRYSTTGGGYYNYLNSEKLATLNRDCVTGGTVR